MSLTYKEQLEENRKLLRNQLIEAEWQCYNNAAENLRKRIKQIEEELEKL